MSRGDGRSTAEDWADEWLQALLRSPARIGRLERERNMRPWDGQLFAEREYDEKTEQLRRFLRGESERRTA